MKKIFKYFLMLTSVSAAVLLCDNSSYRNVSFLSPVFSSESTGSEDLIGTDLFSSVTSGEAPASSDTESDQYPETFDLRDYGLVSKVRAQGSYGTCWAICATESLETQLLKNKYETNPNLSEWHLAYFAYTGQDAFYTDEDNKFIAGGTNTVATAILSRWIGAVQEGTVPYDSSPVIDDCLRYECDYQIQDVYNLHPWLSIHRKYSTSSLKELVYDQNSVSVFYNCGEQYYNPSTFSYCCTGEGIEATHAVLLVGWDDNYPRENFLADNKPEHNGAWLVKNSWGTNWGNDGYFWLSYEDTSLCEGSCYFCEPKDTYKKEYSYDDFGWVSSISADSKQTSLTGYMANIFHADSDDNISAVGFYTTEENAEYEITIYSDLTNTRIPTKGTASEITSGTEKYTGYHTVKLNTPVAVTKDSAFSVVIKIKNPSFPYNIPVEASAVTIRKSAFSTSRSSLYIPLGPETYQSYISSDGSTWLDAGQAQYSYRYPEKMDFNPKLSALYSITLGNICIKAFSSSQPVNKYDINKDGSVNSIDVMILSEYFLTGSTDIELSLDQNEFDLNNDRMINIIDIISIKEYLLS